MTDGEEAKSMLITRESDYAIRILRKLSDGNMYTAGEISKTGYVPEAFAYKILNKLSKAGITDAVRGHTGGYKLAVDLKELSVYDLMRAIEAKMYLNACTDPEHHCPYKEHHGECAIHQNMMLLQRELEALLKKMSVYDLTIPQESILFSASSFG